MAALVDSEMIGDAEKMPVVCAVLPASGVGERMTLACPKQFCSVLGRPLISYTIESFEKIPWIKNIIVAVSSNYLSYLQEILVKFSHERVTLVEGSSTRHRSIYNGVRAVNKVCSNAKVVVIHDAVRPFIDEQTVCAVVKAAFQSGAAGVVRPLVSTVVATDLGGYLDHSLDRSKYRLSEMPQAFTLDVIQQAYEKSTDFDLDYGTECLHLVQRYAGVRVQLIDGPEHLWKVTYKRDLYTMEGILKAARSVGLVFRGNPDTEVEKNVETALLSKHEDSISLVTCVYKELEQFSSSGHLLNSVIICHNSTWMPEDITASTYGVTVKLGSSIKPRSVLTVVHLLLSDYCSSEIILLVMSTVKKCQEGARHLINAVLSNTEGLSKAIDIIRSLIKDQNPSFGGQTFVVGTDLLGVEESDL